MKLEAKRDLIPQYQTQLSRGVGERLKEPLDRQEISPEDLTSNGRLPVIIEAADSTTLEALKKLCKTPGSKITGELPIINAFTAALDPNTVGVLAGIQGDYQVWIDRKYQWIDPEPIQVEPLGNMRAREEVGLLDNANVTLQADQLNELGLTGKKGTLLVVDTGIDSTHKDFEGKIVGWKDFIKGKKIGYDDQGHGTHCASDAAGTGAASDGLYKGTAPDAKIAATKVLDKNGAGRLSDIIKGVNWGVMKKDELDIRVLSMSLGGPVFQSWKESPVNQAVEKAVDAGIVAFVAAGNSGPKPGTIGTPGNDPKVITIGALNNKHTAEEGDDDPAKFSSVGPTPIDNEKKPDVMSPGVLIIAATAYGSVLDQHPKVPHVGKDYIMISGTSMATPKAAGVGMDLVEARPDLDPDQWKEILRETARELPGISDDVQGKGSIRGKAAYEAAIRYPEF
ncbi:MAG: S8 family peptidase [Armatimonadetes bacterium]|nr:S8 family peptidase [Armatimonadota bacterium]